MGAILYITTAIYFFLALQIALGFIITMFLDGLQVSKIDKVYTVIKFFASFSTALLHAHTFWKLHEIISFANCSSEFGDSFLGEYLLSQKPWLS